MDSLKEISAGYIINKDIQYSEETLNTHCREYLDFKNICHLFENDLLNVKDCKSLINCRKGSKFSITSHIYGFFNLSLKQINTLIDVSEDLFGVILYLIHSNEIFHTIKYNDNPGACSKSDKKNTGQNLKYAIDLMKKYPEWYKDHLNRTDSHKFCALFNLYRGTNFNTLRIIGENSIMTDDEFCRVFLLTYENLHKTNKHFEGREGSFIAIIYNHCTRSRFMYEHNMENFVYLSKRGMFIRDALTFILRNKYINYKDKNEMNMTKQEFCDYWSKRILN